MRAYPQEAGGEIVWLLGGSAGWLVNLYASAIERLDPEKLPDPVSVKIHRKEEIHWEETEPDRKVKDIDIIQYSGPSMDGKQVHIGNLTAAFTFPYKRSQIPKGHIVLDVAEAVPPYGFPVRCTNVLGGREFSIYTDAPESNLAHKIIRAFEPDPEKKKPVYQEKAITDLKLMEPLVPIMDPDVFFEYIFDELVQPNDLFEFMKDHGNDGAALQESFDGLPDVWKEFLEGTMMHPSSRSQRFMSMVGIMDLSFFQRLQYFSVFTHYIGRIPVFGIREYLQDCHRRGEPIDYNVLDSWIRFE